MSSLRSNNGFIRLNALWESHHWLLMQHSLIQKLIIYTRKAGSGCLCCCCWGEGESCSLVHQQMKLKSTQDCPNWSTSAQNDPLVITFLMAPCDTPFLNPSKFPNTYCLQEGEHTKLSFIIRELVTLRVWPRRRTLRAEGTTRRFCLS